jgi:hypothetical protein
MIIDADAHVVETAHTWDYLDGSEKKYRPQLFQSAENPNAQYWFLDGKNIGFRNATLSEQELIALSKATGRTLQTAADARELRDVELRLHNGHPGIDVQILFNTMWIARWRTKPRRKSPCGSGTAGWRTSETGKTVSLVLCRTAMTIGEALQQIRCPETAQSPSFALEMTSIGRTLFLSDLGSELLDTIAVHIANGSPQLMDQFKPRYDKMGGFAQFRIPTVITCLSLMMSDVPTLFPKLRWAFVEASAQWIPWVVNEAIRRSGTKIFPKNPCKEFRIYITAQTDDDFPYVLKYAGEDNIVIGTDYGHTDASSEVDAIEVFRKNSEVSDTVKKKILDDNPRTAYGL